MHGAARARGVRSNVFVLQVFVPVEPFVAVAFPSYFFNFVLRANPAARSRRHAVHSRRRAAKFKYRWKCVAAQQGISEASMEDVARAGCVHRSYPERGAIVELSSIPRQHSIAAARRSGNPAAQASVEFQQRLE